MRFDGFDAETNRLLLDAYDEAMSALSTDPNLSLDLIYRSQNLVSQRLNDIAAHGIRNQATLRDAAIRVITEARSQEHNAMQLASGKDRNDMGNYVLDLDDRNNLNRQGEENE